MLDDITNVSECNGPEPDLPNSGGSEACDGAIDISIHNASGTISYAWSGPNGFTSNQQDISGLCTGTYNLQVNINGCILYKSYEICCCQMGSGIPNSSFPYPLCVEDGFYTIIEIEGDVDSPNKFDFGHLLCKSL